jgi:hypothetical protein
MGETPATKVNDKLSGTIASDTVTPANIWLNKTFVSFPSALDDDSDDDDDATNRSDAHRPRRPPSLARPFSSGVERRPNPKRQRTLVVVVPFRGRQETPPTAQRVGDDIIIFLAALVVAAVVVGEQNTAAAVVVVVVIVFSSHALLRVRF